MEVETLGLFIITEVLLSLSPGPAVMLVIGLSVRHGFKIGFGSVLGIISTNAIYFTLSAVGVGAMILASATLFTIIKWIGAAYLAYLGINMLKPLVARMRGRTSGDEQVISIQTAVKSLPSLEQDFRRSFIKGFILQASNPKNIAFFVAILPQFVSTDGNVAGQLIILGIASVLLELPILVFYGLASSKSAKWMTAKTVDWIEGIGGVILVSMGAALATYKRSV